MNYKECNFILFLKVYPEKKREAEEGRREGGKKEKVRERERLYVHMHMAIRL